MFKFFEGSDPDIAFAWICSQRICSRSKLIKVGTMRVGSESVSGVSSGSDPGRNFNPDPKLWDRLDEYFFFLSWWYFFLKKSYLLGVTNIWYTHYQRFPAPEIDKFIQYIIILWYCVHSDSSIYKKRRQMAPYFTILCQ